MTLAVPGTFVAAEGWEIYLDAPTWDAAAAATLTPGDDTAEAAVAHFYGSFIRKDERYLEVLPAAHSDTLKRKLASMQGWVIHSARLVSRKVRGPGKVYIKVELDLERGDRRRPFRDDVTVDKDGAAWRVTRPPT